MRRHRLQAACAPGSGPISGPLPLPRKAGQRGFRKPAAFARPNRPPRSRGAPPTPAGVESLQVRAEIGALAFQRVAVKPAEAIANRGTGQASRPCLRINFAPPQANERARIDIEAAHHLVHANRLSFRRAAGVRSHTAPSRNILPPLRLRWRFFRILNIRKPSRATIP
jgi:hypothetical protein